MKAIIFGANGQDGYYLEKLLIKENVEVTAVSRNGDNHIVRGNITDRKFIETLISTVKPDYVFNLAANSSTHYDHLFENHETISTGTLNVLDAVWKYSRNSKVFLCGSGLQFVNKNSGIKETDPFDATNPYSISRIQSVYAARYFRTLGLNIYVGYLFNHDSPLRSLRHVNQKIAQAAKSIAMKGTKHLELGNLEVQKEFAFAGDIVEGIWTFVNNSQNVFETVIGSGKAYTIRHWVELCFNYHGLNWSKYIINKEGFKSEYDILVSNPETINSLGWKPKVSIDKLCEMFCEV
jgi:GDPmannose 4,6-dehydratase